MNLKSRPRPTWSASRLMAALQFFRTFPRPPLSGLIHFSPANRVKSASVEWRTKPRSIAKAGERYTALRDVIARGAAAPFRALRGKVGMWKSANGSSPSDALTPTSLRGRFLPLRAVALRAEAVRHPGRRVGSSLRSVSATSWKREPASDLRSPIQTSGLHIALGKTPQ